MGVCVIDGLGATKTRLFGKKSGGIPNPQVKKVGVTPNSDQIFAAAAARRGANAWFSAASKQLFPFTSPFFFTTRKEGGRHGGKTCPY